MNTVMDKNNKGWDLPQRLIALGLSLLLCFQLLPVTALAAIIDASPETLAAKKALMEESWTRLTAPVDDLVKFLYLPVGGYSNDEINRKTSEMCQELAVYPQLAEDYYVALTNEADTAEKKSAAIAAMGAQLATWTTLVTDYYFNSVATRSLDSGYGATRNNAQQALKSVKKIIGGESDNDTSSLIFKVQALESALDSSLFAVPTVLATPTATSSDAAIMEEARIALKGKWVALHDATTTDASQVNGWLVIAGDYNERLYQYAVKEDYPSQYTNWVYGVEKLQGMADFYQQEYLEALAKWKRWKDTSDDAEAARENYYKNVTLTQQALCGQINDLIKAAMEEMAGRCGLTFDPNESLAEQLIRQMARMEEASRTTLENSLNPYSDAVLASLTDAQIGYVSSNTDGITRDVAMRSYLRLQQANLRFWHDTSAETVTICTDILNGSDIKWQQNDKTALENDDIFDLRMTRVENQAYAAYSGCMLEFVNTAFEDYERLGVSEEDDNGAAYPDVDYETAKSNWEAAKVALASATQTEAEKLAAWDTARLSTATTLSTVTTLNQQGAARSAYEAAQKETKEKERAVAEALAAMYRAAVNSGQDWQNSNRSTVTTWLNAYRGELVSNAKNEYNAKKSACDEAKDTASATNVELSQLKADMDQAEADMDAARATYTDNVTKCIEYKAAMNAAEKDSDEYNAALNNYTKYSALTENLYAVAKEKSVYYNQQAAAYENQKKVYDEQRASATSLQKEADALDAEWRSLASQTDFTYPAVPTINPDGNYTPYTLELMMTDARDRIAECREGVESLYLEMIGDSFATAYPDAKKGEKIYRFNAYAAELAGQETRLADLEKAVAANYHPATLDSAIESARAAVEDYYFAQWDYYEFRDMEYNMALYAKWYGIDTVFSSYIDSEYHPEAYAMVEAAQTLAENYQAELDTLQKTMAEQEAVMNEKLGELKTQELQYEKTLKSAAQINIRVNQLQLELNDQANGKKALYLNEAKKVFSSFPNDLTTPVKYASLTSIIYGNTYHYSENMLMLAAFDAANEKPADYAVSFEDFCAVGYFLNTQKVGVKNSAPDDAIAYSALASLGNSELSAAVRDFNNDKYRQAFIDYKVAEAMYSIGENRDNMLARINRMGDQYALQVNTGSVDGNGVLFFTVVYTDTDGFERKEYIFPFVDGYENTLLEAGSTMAQNMQVASGTTIDPLACAVNQGHMDTMAKLGQSGKLAGNTPLQAWSSDIYMFRTQYEMAKKTNSAKVADDVEYFETFVERQQFRRPDGTVVGTAKNTWACTGMRLFHLEDFFGVSAYGYGGGPQTQMQLEFTGERIAALENISAEGGSISWVTDELITMGKPEEAGQKYRIVSTMTDYRTGKVGENSGGGLLDRVSDENSEYLFELDFADTYGAGIEGLVNLVTDTRQRDIKKEDTETKPDTGGTVSTNTDTGGTVSTNTDTGSTVATNTDTGSTVSTNTDTGGTVSTNTDTGSTTNGETDVNNDSPTSGVGINPNAKTSIWDLGLAECLTYIVAYKDDTGTTRRVSIPVISSSLAWALDHGVDGNDKIFGYAQQGDKIVFSAYLPEMKEIIPSECKLMFEYVNNWKQSGKQSGAATANFTKRTELIQDDAKVLLSGVQIYAPGTYEASAEVVQGRIVPTVTAVNGGAKTPAYYVTAPQSSKGIVYENGPNAIPLALESWNNNILQYPWDCSNLYMLVIQTDDPDLAGTKVSPSITLNYTTASGRTKTSHSASLEGDGLDFYGYWPGYENKDITVLQATGAKGQLKLLYNLKDENGNSETIKSFNSVTISMPSNTNDDWQISGLYIMKVDSVGERFAMWENITDGDGNLLSDRRYDRTVTGMVMTSPIDLSKGKILLQSGDEKVITFENGSNPEVIATETDWNSVQYYMDYNEALSDFGFTKTRETYTVKVQVNDEGASTISDGDCGSNNNFYFQLVFANGRSAYVLANQQLSGDGFRTGYVETFNIKTNRDYGELQAVRIIPDDNSSESELFDKLNIKRIKVSKNSNDSVNRTWVITDIGDNGWISFDYHDDAESYGILGRPGRSESEMCVNCPVGYVTYSTKLLFALATGQVKNDTMIDTLNELIASGADEETLAKCREVIANNPQYQGQLSMTLLYRNNEGNVESMTVDVVSAMATYANKVADREEKIDAQGNYVTGTQYLSSKEYMFRPGKTDRFEVDVSDVTEIVSIDLIPTSASTQASFWKVESLDVYMLKGTGILNINVNNEYQKTNETEYLCGIKSGFTFYCPAANPEKKSFTVTENRLEVESGNGDTSWSVAVSREPESKNDVANIYIYASLAKMVADGPVNKLYGQLQYTNSYGQIYKSAMRDMNMISGVEGGYLFYTAGVDIPNISVLNNVSAELVSTRNTVVIDRIVVQQVRSGVVISTYTIEPGGMDKMLSETCLKRSFMPDNTTSGGEIIGRGDKQIVTIGFGDNTDAVRLVNENRDIGIALRYTSTNDVAATKQVYQSPYIYLTDQDIIAICAKGTAQIEFNEQYVDEIEGIVAFATGGLKADISAVSIESLKAGLEGATDDNYTRRGWYSVIETKALDLGGQKFNTYKGNAGGTNQIVSPYTVELTTGAVAPTDSKLEMVLTYKRLNSSEEETITFPNIRNNLVSGGFSANQKAVIRVMLNNSVGEVLSVAFRPTGKDARWSITGLRTELAYTGEGVNIPKTNLTADADQPVAFDAIVDQGATLSVTATYNGTKVSNTLAGDMVFNDVGAEEPVTIEASMTGSADTIVVKVVRVEGATETDVTKDTLTGGGGSWTFTSSYSMDATYRITVSLQEHSSETAVITIHYKAPVNNPGDALTLDLVTLILTAGTGQRQLVATNGTGTITWSSSDNTVATVENGLVKAAPEAQAGSTAVITAREDSTGRQATCQVTLAQNASEN